MIGKRSDGNQSEIVKELRKIPGVTVELDHNDILLGYDGHTYWFEIKVSEKKAREKQLKNSQKRIKKNFSGHYSIVWSIDQILKEIGIQK